MRVTAVLFAIAFSVATAALSGPAQALPQDASSGGPDARLAEERLRQLITAAASGTVFTYDFDRMTEAVANAVRSDPDTGEMVLSWGPAKSMTLLGSPPGGYLFRIVYETVQIDFFIALNPEGRITAMYFHPARDGDFGS
jgi:hypothetical protein